MNYYYFAATLPALALDEPPPLRQDEFLARCREHLRPTDFETLSQVFEPHPTRRADHPFLQAWQRSEVLLRNALARARAAHRGCDVAPFLRPEASPDSAVDQAAKAALEHAVPLDRELALDRFRWTQAEQLAGYDPFALESILAYALKLKLVERWAALDAKVGRHVVDTLIAQPMPVSAG